MKIYGNHKTAIPVIIGIIKKYSKDPFIRGFTVQILKQARVPYSGELGQLMAVYNWVKRNIKYRKEEKDIIYSPKKTISMGFGDCEDVSAVLSSMLGSLNFPIKLKVTATRPGKDFNHVLVLAGTPKNKPRRWYILDATWKGVGPEPPYHKEKVFEIS